MKFMPFAYRSVVCDPNALKSKLVMGFYEASSAADTIVKGVWSDRKGNHGRFVADYPKKDQYHKIVFRFNSDLSFSSGDKFSKIRKYELVYLDNSSQELVTNVDEDGIHNPFPDSEGMHKLYDFTINPSKKKASISLRYQDHEKQYTGYIQFLPDQVILRTNSQADSDIDNGKVLKGKFDLHENDGIIELAFANKCYSADNYQNCDQNEDNWKVIMINGLKKSKAVGTSSFSISSITRGNSF